VAKDQTIKGIVKFIHENRGKSGIHLYTQQKNNRRACRNVESKWDQCRGLPRRTRQQVEGGTAGHVFE